MELNEALYSYLSTYSGLTALVGDRIHPAIDVPPDAPLPFITYQEIDNPQIHTSGTDDGPYRPRYQFNCWGRTYNESCTIAVQMRAALKDKTGQIGGESGVTLQRAFLEDENELLDATTKLKAKALDFIIWHE